MNHPAAILKSLLFAIFFLVSTSAAFAFTGDISIDTKDIVITPANILEGQKTRIYATAANQSAQDLLGVVRFFDNGRQIGADQPISIFTGKTDGVFIDWIPNIAGDHIIIVKIFPWEPDMDNPDNNSIETTIYVGQDTDHDGITNANDNDDDNDGVNDTEDHFPLNAAEQLDTDGDGKGNNSDTDDDNDDVPDTHDDMPLDPNETIDTDNDGIGNIADLDDDGDGIDDTIEEKNGTNPIKEDTDDDGVNDSHDAFPLDPLETLDTDKDNIGNNADTDDDNDKIPDQEDAFPLNKGPVIALSYEDFSVDLLDKQNFDASPSYDEDGKIVNYTWKIDGKKFDGADIDYTFDKNGNYDGQLTITDNSGESVTREFQISVTNIRYYLQIGATIISLLLALIIYFMYIARDKKEE
ncbi:PKD domain-containing protein [Candidatus Peregrinibacteria bacterium]|nr:PKD domain-containing protein [Candidatus Peregrinibacteria bacterium]